MLSFLYYLFLVGLCTVGMILSAAALVLLFPWDRARRTVHEISRVMVHVFFGVPPLWRVRVEGLEHVDRSKTYVIVINHQAMTDIPTLYKVPLNFRWVSKREVFRIPFFGQFLRLHGDICIDRGHAKQAMEQLLRKGRMWIGRGVSVAIFPEGTRSKDGQIHNFKAGAFELAREAGVELLPVVMDGTAQLVKKNRLFKWRHTIVLNVMKPVSAEHIAATDLKELMAEVHDAMAGRLTQIRKKQA